MAQQQSSRLNRLLTLLDTGSTQATRLTAARQIGEIAKSHPQDLSSLLSKVSQYLRSKKWDTRVAAAHAIGSIAENVKHTTLAEHCSSIEVKMSEAGISGNVEELVVWPKCYPKIGGTSFRSFDLNKVLEFGALLASAGQKLEWYIALAFHFARKFRVTLAVFYSCAAQEVLTFKIVAIHGEKVDMVRVFHLSEARGRHFSADVASNLVLQHH
ncbi:btaf1 RNA polymerase II, B-TFIID transcription factor-associated, 170kDa [Datura stramonium]|uniref:Btaf1 RNA polymerase II, B-TFIID transcription factor-associated, 170kDa n=1 Tax=Datura stramonium TaxID=4076 RepID=A0ABS8S804_DATST|nr:btaf1 RNA polymerase II, B-TFIID transcription factor-associated, 170kDa [Datura stramonium]